jgi:NhaP-type Na+/H+ or K+/H+ antiporter
VLAELLVKNGKETEDVWAKVTLAWGTLHGLVSLAMAGRLPGGNEEAERLVHRAVRDFLNAWLD